MLPVASWLMALQPDAPSSGSICSALAIADAHGRTPPHANAQLRLSKHLLPQLPYVARDS